MWVLVNSCLPTNFSFNDSQQQIPVHVFALPLHPRAAKIVGTVALFHDTSYIDEQVLSRTLRDYFPSQCLVPNAVDPPGLALVLGPLDFYGAADRARQIGCAPLRTGQPSAEVRRLRKGEILDQLHHEVDAPGQ